MAEIDVEITGVTALLLNKFSDQAREASGATDRTVIVDRGTPREEADKVVYRSPKGFFYLPGECVMKTMAFVGANHKQTGGSRRSLVYIVPSAVRSLDLEIPILDGAGKQAKDYEVDSRPVVIAKTRGRIVRHRPRFDVWKLKLRLYVNENVLAVATAHKLLNEAGDQSGLGDYRPSCKGPMGTFRVTNWKEMKKPKSQAA